MKKYAKILVLIIISSILLTYISLAESEEKVGFVKKTWRGIFGLLKKPEKEEEALIIPEPERKEEEYEAEEEKVEAQQDEPGLTEPSEVEFEYKVESKVPEEGGEATHEVEIKTTGIGDMPKENIIYRIKHMLEISQEAASFIPELRVTRDENDKVTKVEYKTGGLFKDIENLDKEILIVIHRRINNERTRLQTERIQHQLESIRAAQSVPKPPPQPHTPPVVPQTHTPPPQPPQIPKPPPQPPPQPPRN